MQRTRTAMTAIALAALAGCASQPDIFGESWEPPPAVTPVYEPSTAGSIYNAATHVRLYEDLRANRVGDILTIRLTESTSASNNSATSTNKTTEASLGNITAFGQTLTKDGQALFDASMEGEQSFDGGASTSQSNSLVGDITVTVVERLPNGNLRVRGEKWLNLNQGREFIRVAGIVRPFDIGTDNSIASTRVADAQISYSSRGVMAAANKMGPIARFFQSVLHPY